ncbi:glycosyltransferase family 2 protein [Arthrobacter sp. JSM 101049]|uniref:glycosyltransferase family 2 protein n=1 Tax=Arthrobacter sp. JSM 101049 TaxID=929097 RepID=UPI003565F265
MPAQAPKVSVVVAAYNSPPELDGLVASLDAQSLPHDEFEAIFVDDGSSDGTLDRLRRLAEQRSYMSVHTIANSGWPGRPRNVGTAAARGEYVFYADHDDYLFPEALERMAAFARAHRLDVVHPKEVVEGWSAPGWSAWRREVDRLAEWTPTVIQCITPHKLYRRAFLDEHGIAFPEGKVRLEDFSFNAWVWATTDAVGIFASYPCYRWMLYEDNSHKKGFDFESYWNDFEASLQPLLDLPAGGEKRKHLLVRWYRSRILERLAGIYSTYGATHRLRLDRKFTELLPYFPPELDALLSAADRLRSHLLRAGRFDALLALSALDRGMRLEMKATDVRWRNGTLDIRGNGTLVDRDGLPVRFVETPDGGLRRDLPADLLEALPDAVADVTGDLERAVPHLVIRDRTDSVDWFLPSRGDVVSWKVDGATVVGFEFTAQLDPQTAAFGDKLPEAVWDVFARLPELGYTATHRLKVEPVPHGAALHHGRQAIAYRTKPGYLALDLGSSVRTVVGTAQPGATDVVRRPTATEVTLHRVHAAGPTRIAGHLETATGQVPATLENRGTTAVLRVEGVAHRLQGSRAVFNGRRSAPLLDGPGPEPAVALPATVDARPQLVRDLLAAGRTLAESPSGQRARRAAGRAARRLRKGR